MNQQEAFLEELFEPFDEHADSQELREFADRCDQARTCFLAGDKSEDASLSTAANLLFSEKREDQAYILTIDKGLTALGNFCKSKADAYVFRQFGKIACALKCEAVAEKHYNALPAALRW